MRLLWPELAGKKQLAIGKTLPLINTDNTEGKGPIAKSQSKVERSENLTTDDTDDTDCTEVE
jgi:hypothetical protein